VTIAGRSGRQSDRRLHRPWENRFSAGQAIGTLAFNALQIAATSICASRNPSSCQPGLIVIINLAVRP